jgi:hypothetical protein
VPVLAPEKDVPMVLLCSPRMIHMGSGHKD